MGSSTTIILTSLNTKDTPKLVYTFYTTIKYLCEHFLFVGLILVFALAISVGINRAGSPLSLALTLEILLPPSHPCRLVTDLPPSPQHSFIPHTTSTQASLHESFAHGTKYCNVIEQFKQVIRLNWLLLLGNNNNLCNVHQALIYFLFAHRGITHTKTGTTPSKLFIGG